MNHETNKQILLNYIFGNKMEARRMFKRLDNIEAVHFFNYLHEAKANDPVKILNDLK